MRARSGLGALAALALAAAGGSPGAHAAVMSAMPDIALSATPIPISFGGGAATYAFTSASTGNGPGAAVATSGTAELASLGGLTDFSADATIDQTGELYSFAAFPTATTIPNSAADDYVGLAFTLSDGVHYGYAEVAGPTLVSYGYEATPGASITTGAANGSGATGGGSNAVPEPSSAVLLAAGLVACAAIRRARSQAA